MKIIHRNYVYARLDNLSEGIIGSLVSAGLDATLKGMGAGELPGHAIASLPVKKKDEKDIKNKKPLKESVEPRSTENSLGQPIANSPEAIANFWNWFGSSVTVDEKGRPIVFYHGSYSEFEEFQHPWEKDEYDDNYTEGYTGGNIGTGFYFTKNLEYAKRFGRVKPYYLKITKIYDLIDESNISELEARYAEEKDELSYGAIGEVIDEIMRENKYDGIKSIDVGGLAYGADEWLVISSKQVKALANVGSFDGSSSTLTENIDEEDANTPVDDVDEDSPYFGRQGAGCLFYARDTGNVLFAKRSNKVLEPGTWSGFGGKIDDGENPVEALKRELREEAGYSKEIPWADIIGVSVYEDSEFDFKYYNFLVLVDSEFTPRINDESSAFKWTSLDNPPSPLHYGIEAAYDAYENVISRLQ
jgi:8-oxo-dGTP pyrophosphatase MutT (NUDIX family)